MLNPRFEKAVADNQTDALRLFTDVDEARRWLAPPDAP
jgi:hypothetical protein